MSDSSNGNRAYLGVGITFAALALTMWLTMDSWAVALPFAALSMTFFVLGARPAPPEDADQENEG